MIYEVKMFAGKCDNCKVEVFEGSEYSCYDGESMVEDEISNCDWHEEEGKHYCTACFTIDDEDKIHINLERFRVDKV